MSFQTILFYKYVTIEHPEALAEWVRARAQELHFKGRVIVAAEGINATLEGTLEETQRFIEELRQKNEFHDLKVKTSVSDGNTFPKLRVKVREEIVGTKFSLQDADPRVRTAPHLPPHELHEMYAKNEDFVVVDMRNSYEFASGHFKGSIDPGLRASRDLEKAIVKLEPYKDKKIVTVCTGGVRCEKMSAYLLSHGFKNVYQLEEGIHTYMQKYPGKDFLGTLYTFDDRIVMDFDGEREIVGACHFCKKQTEDYLNCKNDACHLHILACETCQQKQEKRFCSFRCLIEGNLLNLRITSKKALIPLRVQTKRFTRKMNKKYQRLAWKVRLLRQKPFVLPKVIK